MPFLTPSICVFTRIKRKERGRKIKLLLAEKKGSMSTLFFPGKNLGQSTLDVKNKVGFSLGKVGNEILHRVCGKVEVPILIFH